MRWLSGPGFPAALTVFAALTSLPALSAADTDLGLTLKEHGFIPEPASGSLIAGWTRKATSVRIEKTKDGRPPGYLLVNGVRVWLGRSPVIDGDKGPVLVTKTDYDKTVSPLVTPPAVSVPKLPVIVLDAGHGGKDPGNQNLKLGLDEKTMTLDVVRRMKSILEARGYKVALTRSRDVFIERDGRDDIAVRLKADVFVSIHFNAAVSAAATGVETYCLTPAGQHSTNDKTGATDEMTGNRNDSRNILLALAVQKQLVERMETEDRGVRRARWDVLTGLQCPGVLVEGGFMSNPDEAARIAEPVYRERFAQSVCDAIGMFCPAPVAK